MNRYIAVLSFALLCLCVVKGVEDKECEKRKKALQEEIQNYELVDVPLPSCDENGNFKNTQCMFHPMQGCWCADIVTGEEIKGTFLLAALPNDMKCGNEKDQNDTKCYKERKASLKKINEQKLIHDRAKPFCDSDGNYERISCSWFPETQACWCVDPITGDKIQDTYKEGVYPDEINCGRDKSKSVFKLEKPENDVV